MSKDISEYIFNTDLCNIIADSLYEHLLDFLDYNKSKIKKGLVDYSYDLKAGRVDNTEANTWFSFDLKPGTAAFTFMKAMYDREISNEEEQQLKAFCTRIGRSISERNIVGLRNIVRAAVLPSSSSEAIPLTVIDIPSMEIVDYSSIEDFDKHTIRYTKMPGSQVNMQALTSQIRMLKEAQPLLTLPEIIENERRSANPIFDSVLTAELGNKYLWDIQMSMFVDYSMSEEILTKHSPVN